MFFPYFNGAAGPVRDEKLRGTFTGLELGHDRFHMAAAVMEGVVFHTAMVLEDYQKNGAFASKAPRYGGALNSREWMEMMKAVFDCEIQSVVQKDAAALGAAMIAAVGSGLFGITDKRRKVWSLLRQRRRHPKSSERFIAENWKFTGKDGAGYR